MAFVPVGVNARVMGNAKLLYARMFTTGDEALQRAEQERRKMFDQEWSVPTPAPARE